MHCLRISCPHHFTFGSSPVSFAFLVGVVRFTVDGLLIAGVPTRTLFEDRGKTVGFSIALAAAIAGTIRFVKMSCPLYPAVLVGPVVCLLGVFGQPRGGTTEVNPHRVASPDGRLVVTLLMVDGQPHYRAERDGAPVLATSRLGLALDGSTTENAWKVAASHRDVIEEDWNPVWGKQATVRNHAHELTLHLLATDAGHQPLQIIARAYDEGLAIRYVLPQVGDEHVEPLRFERELTEFRFAIDGVAWSYNGEHRPTGPESLADCQGRRRVPLTIRTESGLYLAIHEAALVGLGQMSLSADEGSTSFHVEVPAASIDPHCELPWRVLMIGDTPGQLVDSNLLVNLNPPCAIEDPSWIRPGVSFWDWRAWGHTVGDFRYGLDLPSWMRFVDLAAEAGIPYLLLDADWYGPEFDESSDPVKGGKASDVQEIIRYGRERGIGLFLYLNDAASQGNDLETVLRSYREWGAVGIKYGFMKAQGRARVEKTRSIIEACARHQLLCNFHDGPVHPCGDERTWPNCLTREFCHSQSDAHRVFTPETFCLQVYVNMLAGPIDMCNGLFEMTRSLEERPKIFAQLDSTITAEAARTLIVYSGLTVLADSADSYRSHPELLAFLAAQSGRWVESRTLAGEIGEFIVMMRRSDDTYLVGACTNHEARSLELPLDFLPAGTFEAVIAEDTAVTHFQTNRESYRIRRRAASAADTLSLHLAPGGGACIRLVPRND